VSDVSELNKQKIRLFVDAVVNEGRLELIDELVAADYVGRFSCVNAPVTGPAGVHEFLCGHRRANPGLYIEIKDQIAEQDRVVTRWQAAVPPRAAPAPACATSTPFPAGISIIRLLAGKQVDCHCECTSHTAQAAIADSVNTPSTDSGARSAESLTRPRRTHAGE
jgi:SnoaL-like domain